MKGKLAVVVIIVAFVTCGLWTSYQIYAERIGVIGIEGDITDFSEYTEQIKTAMDDSAIKAVVLKVDSPGGTVLACFEVEEYIEKLTEEKPVVATLGDLAASGAYYVICPADYIYAHKNTLTGGLGIISVWVDLSEWYERERIKIWVWKTGKYKDMGASWREPTAEENKMIEDMINAYLETMLSDIYEYRSEKGLTKGALDAVADGSIWDGSMAKEMLFVDDIGDYSDALEKARELAGLTPGKYLVVNLNEKPSVLIFIDALIKGFTGIF